MNRSKQLFLSGLLVFVLICRAESTELKFAGGRFKIVQFTDLHCINGAAFEKFNDSTITLMQTIIEEEKPNLVIITGDIVVSGGALEVWKQVVQPMVKTQTPFAVTFGNHDTEADMTKKQVLKFLKSVPVNMTCNADDNIDGVGNCYFPIKSSAEGADNWILYLFDSHAYPQDRTLGTYDWIKFSQIDWYRKQSDKLTQQNERTLPSLAFFHIPTPEYREAAGHSSGLLGNNLEACCAPSLNSGLLTAFLEKKDVLGTFVGHDHNNDFIVAPEGKICLAYGRKTGYASAYEEVLERGARVIELYENERRFDTYIRTLSGKFFPYTFEQKLGSVNYPAAEGTFIQDHLVANWDDKRWQQEFAMLKEAGMKYLILAPTLHTDTSERVTSLYPSKIPHVEQKYKNDLVDLCLRNAQKAGFKVFLGLNMHEKWWSHWSVLGPEWFYRQMELGNQVADELIQYRKKYPDAFYGWYWVWEVANVAELNRPDYQDVLAHSLNMNLDHLTRIAPSMPFMLAPFMNHRLGSAEEYGKAWEAIFAKAHFRAGDIFAPQDCVGAGGLEIDMVPAWFNALNQAVSTKPGLLFWSDAETFDHRFWTSAPLNRFVKQMELVVPYVSKIITFAYSHYYAPGKTDGSFHKAYVQYYRTGKLPELPVPGPVTDLTFGKGTKGNRILRWKAPQDAGLVAGYYIYRNDELIGNVPCRPNRRSSPEFTDEKAGEGSGRYEVAAYNCLGVASEKVQPVQK